MRYILDSEGYVEAVTFSGFITCNNNSCTEYTGSIPSGYTSLEEWNDNANIRAYKIENGNLVYDSNKDAELQALWKEQEANNQSEGISIETITNENGTAIKFSDGTMICRGSKNYDSATFAQLGGVYYRVLTGITFPVPFIEQPVPTASMNMGNVGSITTSGGTTATGIGGFSVISANAQARAITVFWTATGRWK